MTGQELAFAPAWKLVEMISSKKISSTELTKLFLERIERLDPQLNAYITVVADQALAAASKADAAVEDGEPLGPLHGVPIGIKDLAGTKGIRTTRGSLALKDFVPDVDEVMVSRVKNAGAVILGKTNLPEFGHLPTNENRLGDACRNPWDISMTSGGSSGGAAAGLAAGLHPLATGTDAGGSIRIPASLCGVYGIRPSQGRVPKFYQPPGGWMVFAQAGPMANTVKDAAVLLQVMAGPHASDPTALRQSPPDFTKNLDSGVKGLSVGWSADLGSLPVDSEVRRVTTEAAHAFEAMGARVSEISVVLDHANILDVFKTIFMSDLAAGAGGLAATRGDELSPSLLTLIEETRTWPVSKLALALRELEWHRVRMDELMGKFDLLLTPSVATTAFPVGLSPSVIDGQSVDPVWGFTPFSYPFNMSGHPAASVPCGFSINGLPIGLHIAGQFGGEATVLRASAAYESAHPWANRRPALA
jgi:Asp-tRNA(Asn)/Glu-tRNA(Gln) amidotransferase A subunit family amidase